jgi:hypothetical protein
MKIYKSLKTNNFFKKKTKIKRNYTEIVVEKNI